MPTLQQLILITALMTVAAGIQGSFGFGVGLLANPLLALINPNYIGVPMLICAIMLNTLVLLRERASKDLTGLEWAIAGRVLGTGFAAWLLTRMSEDMMTIAFGGLVLVAVALSVARFPVAVGKISLLSASLVSGVMGTVASIGGPPLALLFQNSPGPKMRPTLAVFLLVGNLLSVAALAIIGHFGTLEIVLALTLIPGTLLGYFASSRLLSSLAPAALRKGVLLISTASALAALAPYFFRH